MNSTQLSGLLNEIQTQGVVSGVLATIVCAILPILKVINQNRREVINEVSNSPQQEMLNEKLNDIEEKLNKSMVMFDSSNSNQTHNFRNTLFFSQKNTNGSMLEDTANNITKLFR